MSDSLALPLPPLRRKILRSFLLVVLIYGLFGFFIMASVFFSSGVTPRMIHLNYDSISAASRMREAWDAFRNPGDHAQKNQAQWVTQFEAALAFEMGNITEPGEKEAALAVRQLWASVKDHPARVAEVDSTQTYYRTNRYLDKIVLVNEAAMFRLAEESNAFRFKVFFAAAALFALTLLFALFLADGLAFRLASPLKEMAEALRNKPMPGEKLRLPTPTSLEVRILTHEMNQLWKRLSELRKLNVEEIALQRSKLETVLEAVEDGIIVIDASDVVVQCNDELLKVLGLPADKVVDHLWSDLPTAADGYLILRRLLTSTLEKDTSVELQVGESRRIFSIRSRPIHNKSGAVVGTLFLLHDMTERRQRERLKSEFIGVLSHELKTPLQSLGTAAELLSKRKQALDEEGQVLIDTLNEDVARIRAVAQDFVQVGLVDSRYLRLKIGRHALSELIQEWVKPFRIVARDRQVQIRYEQDAKQVVWANIDVVKFPWAVSNLLSNAIRFSPPNSAVTVFLREDQSQVVIEIRDEGPGIPESVRLKMFDPYYQAPTSDTGPPSGFLGLGLTIAKEVVEAHQGKIEYSPGKPKGSIFRIALPLATTENWVENR